MSGPDSMEKSSILLPTLKDGVVWLGDLWDCRNSIPFGNLFEKPLKKEHLEPHPMSNLTYKMERVKNARDFVANMYISVELNLECAGGTVSVKGKAHFDRKERQDFHQENILCNYDTTTYEVRLRQRALEIGDDEEANVISPDLVELINAGTLSATHYVHAVVLGGQAQASIVYYKNIDKSHMNLGGSLEGTIKIGPVTATAKASLDLLDDESNEEHSTEVSVKAQPGIGAAPTSCEAMFKSIESLDDVLIAEQHFPQLNTDHRKIFGVPMQFKLLPITRIPGIKERNPTYALLKEETLAAYSDMLLTLSDYSIEDYLKSKVRTEAPGAYPILEDSLHPVTSELDKLSLTMSEKAVPLKLEAVELFYEYKLGNKKEEDLQTLVGRYQEIMTLPELDDKVRQFAESCRLELSFIRAADVIRLVDDDGNPAINFCTNQGDLDDWWNVETTPRILLKTGSQDGSEGSVFHNLYTSAVALRRAGVEVGVAFPSISTEFVSHIKTSSGEGKFEGKGISRTLDLLKLSVGIKSGYVFHLFHSINAELSTIRLPMTAAQLTEFFVLERIMSSLSDQVEIVETYCELLALIVEKSKESWNLVIPIDAVDRGLEMIRALQTFRSRFESVKVSWIVSRFEVSSKYSSPFLFVFKGSVLTGICFDLMDVAILADVISTGDVGPLKITEARKSCLYIEQWNYAAQVVPNFALEHNTSLSQLLAHHEEFPPISSSDLHQAIQVVRALAVRDDPAVATTIAKFALIHFRQELEPILVTRCGWADEEIPSENWENVEWASLAEDVEAMIHALKPYLLMVSSATKALSSLKEPELEPPPEDSEEPDPNPVMHLKIDEIIAFIVATDDSHELAPLRDQLKKLNDVEKWMDRRALIVRECNIFLLSEEDNKDYFHLLQLITASNQMLHKGSLMAEPKPIASSYCSPVLDSSDYSEFPEFLKELEAAINEEKMFACLQLLDRVTVHPKIYKLQNLFQSVRQIPASIETKGILELVSTFEENEMEVVWQNPRFLYLVRSALDSPSALEAIYAGLSSLEKLPYFIPQDILDKVKPLITRKMRNAEEFPWVTEWGGEIALFIEQLQSFMVRGQVPDEFQSIFHKQLTLTLQEALAAKGALKYWNSEKQIFDNTWTIHTVQEVLPLLMETRNAAKQPSTVAKNEKIHKQLSKSEIPLSKLWKPFSQSGTMELCTLSDAFKLGQSLPLPRQTLSFSQLHETLDILLPYILQNLESDTLHPDQMTGLIDYPISGHNPGHIDFGQGLPPPIPINIFKSEAALTALLQSNDAPLIHHILSSLSRQGLALPLLVESMDERDKSVWKFFYEILQQVLIPHRVNEFYFSPPYRFVLTLRVGDTRPLAGRSSLLNKLLLGNRQTFGSLFETGSNLGRSLGRNGMLELLPLTEDTCDPAFFELVKKIDHQLLLGILHGDALELEDSVVTNLLPYASSVLTFWRVENWKQLKVKNAQLKEKLRPIQLHMHSVVLYGESSLVEHVGLDNILLSLSGDELEDQLNAAKLRKIVGQALESSTVDKLNTPKGQLKPFIIAPNFGTQGSERILKLLMSHTFPCVKTAITAALKENEFNTVASEIGNAYVKILQEQEMDHSFQHLQVELDRLSQFHSLSSRAKVNSLREQLANDRGNEHLKSELKLQLELVERHVLLLSTLTLFGAKYLLKFNLGMMPEFVSALGSMITNGFAIPLSEWVESELSHVLMQSIELLKLEKVCTLSIAGPKSSGKSSLLNQLFGGHYLPSWSATKGVELRLVWVSDELTPPVDADAVLLVDTEGIATIEDEDDPIAFHEAVKLLSALVSTSDLVLLNFRENDYGEFVTVFKSALASLLKESGSVLPSFKIVQQGGSGGGADDAVVQEILGVAELAEQNWLEIGFHFKERIQMAELNSSIFRDKMRAFVFKGKDDVPGLKAIIQQECAQSRMFDMRKDITTLIQRYLQVWEVMDAIHVTEKIQGLPALSKTSELTVLTSKAFGAHEDLLMSEFRAELDKIFQEPSEMPYDRRIELLLQNSASKLFTVIEDCQLNKQKTFLGLKSVNPNSCSDCNSALLTKEELRQSLRTRTKATLTSDQINYQTQLQRYQTYNNFRQIALSQQIKERKSEAFRAKVLELIETNMSHEQNYQTFIQYLSNLQFMPKWSELFVAEFREMFQSIAPTKLEIDLERIPVLLEAPFYTESTVVTPLRSNQLGWEDAVWLRQKLEEIPFNVFEELGAKAYRYGMGVRVGQETVGVLELLATKMGVVLGIDGFLPDFVWTVLSLVVQVGGAWLDEEENRFRELGDAVRILEADKDTFIEDPGSYFEGVDLNKESNEN